MQPVSFKRDRFPPDVVRLAVWLYFRFTLSFREVEEMLAHRSIEASYETGRWHLDEMVVKIRGKRMWLWRAVDDEGEVLDMLVQKRRHTGAALRLLRKLLRRNGIHPESFTTDKLASYRTAFQELHCGDGHRPGRIPDDNRAENSHLVVRRRERKQQRFKSHRRKTPDRPVDPPPLSGRSGLRLDGRGRLSDHSVPAHSAVGDST